MNKPVPLLSVIMGAVVLASNYLGQFPIYYYGLSEILTYGAFTYPIAFLITDLANRSYGKEIAKKIVYFGFFIGVSFTLFFLLPYICDEPGNINFIFLLFNSIELTKFLITIKFL